MTMLILYVTVVGTLMVVLILGGGNELYIYLLGWMNVLLGVWLVTRWVRCGERGVLKIGEESIEI